MLDAPLLTNANGQCLELISGASVEDSWVRIYHSNSVTQYSFNSVTFLGSGAASTACTLSWVGVAHAHRSLSQIHHRSSQEGAFTFLEFESGFFQSLQHLV